VSKTRSVGATDRFRICEGVSARRFDGEWVVLDLNGGNYFGLDELGGVVWQQIGQGRTPADIAALVAPGYQVPAETVLEDVLDLLQELVERGLARVNG
jgi:hypothetical protein